MGARLRWMGGALLFLVLLLGAAACTLIPATTTQVSGILSPCPVPTPNLLPTAWQPVGGTFINVDGDEDLECLVTYRYNISDSGQAQLGGVVFDAQASAEQPSNLVSYSLLPWTNSPFNAGSPVPGSSANGTGYLGDKTAEVRLYDTGTDGKPDELGILGTDASGNNSTTFSLYRWNGDGYRLIGYFHGDARVEIVDPPPFITATNYYRGAVTTVRTFDRLNDRSGLAVVKQYDRKGQTYEYRSNWVDFSNGRPAQTCYFPEGQTLIYYHDRGRAVFDLRLASEDDTTRHATVCAGVWELFSGQWRRYVATVELEKTPASAVGACDQWAVLYTQTQPGWTTCPGSQLMMSLTGDDSITGDGSIK